MDPRQVLLDQRARLERKFKEERIVEREVPDLRKYLVNPNVLAILGVRRSGKSTMAEALLRGENFGYVNFDDERLANLRTEDLSRIEKAIYELFGEVEYFLLDEVQNVGGWELFVNRLREDGEKIVVTWNYEDEWGDVRFVPLWKFLLAGDDGPATMGPDGAAPMKREVRP